MFPWNCRLRSLVLNPLLPILNPPSSILYHWFSIINPQALILKSAISVVSWGPTQIKFDRTYMYMYIVVIQWVAQGIWEVQTEHMLHLLSAPNSGLNDFLSLKFLKILILFPSLMAYLKMEKYVNVNKNSIFKFTPLATNHCMLEPSTKKSVSSTSGQYVNSLTLK